MLWTDNSLAIPNQISTISMQMPSLVTIHWYLLTLSAGNENTDVSWADDSVKNWQNLPLSKPDLHNVNAQTKFGENPLTLTQVIFPNWKYGRWTYQKGWTDIHMENHDIIIPRHYRIVWRGIKRTPAHTSRPPSGPLWKYRFLCRFFLLKI